MPDASAPKPPATNPSPIDRPQNASASMLTPAQAPQAIQQPASSLDHVTGSASNIVQLLDRVKSLVLYHQSGLGNVTDHSGNIAQAVDDVIRQSGNIPHAQSALTDQEAYWLRLLKWATGHEPDAYHQVVNRLEQLRGMSGEGGPFPNVSISQLAQKIREQDIPRGQKGTLKLYAQLIVHIAHYGRVQYDKMKALRPGTSSNTLCSMLRRLVEKGLLRKTMREHFVITDKARALLLACQEATL